MGFSYFSYNQDCDDREKEEAPSFSPSDYNNVDERRDVLGIDFFKLNYLVLSLRKEECFKTLNMHDEEEEDGHKIACKSLIMSGGGGGDEGLRKIEWGYFDELIAELLNEFDLSLERSLTMDSGQYCSCVIEALEEDDGQDSLEHHSNIKEFIY
ncbi:hypothetical protein SADUNF_Sadunf01G0109000 [Salix dunnii]|uniref:Uncharacterized protein n=1 Tax=Salix dunnii TaxID=1413687 RepID=A0A835TN30_9ROSI|nr:hypothetical protein SADUNF_Sadunf01G0109000 [Salix dunnii]